MVIPLKIVTGEVQRLEKIASGHRCSVASGRLPLRSRRSHRPITPPHASPMAVVWLRRCTMRARRPVLSTHAAAHGAVLLHRSLLITQAPYVSWRSHGQSGYSLPQSEILCLAIHSCAQDFGTNPSSKSARAARPNGITMAQAFAPLQRLRELTAEHQFVASLRHLN